MNLFNFFKNKASKDKASKNEAEIKMTPNNEAAVKQKKSTKRKTLVKDFDKLIEEGDIEKCKAVFQKCQINAYDTFTKNNALSYRGLTKEFILWLVDQGIDINYIGRWEKTPLHYQASYRDGQASLLIELGADIEAKDYDGCTPLFYATDSHMVENVRALVEAGANVKATNSAGQNALEYMLIRANSIFLPQIYEMSVYLLNHGYKIKKSMKKAVKEIGEDIEFYRTDNSHSDESTRELIENIDRALAQLYKLFKVKPVPRRIQYDGKAKITVQSKTWQKQYEELWAMLIPGSGAASTIQGEVIRVCGRLSHEILDNGKVNWDKDFLKMARALPKYLMNGNLLSEEENSEVHHMIADTSHMWEDECNRLTELCVKWVILNPEPMPLDKVEYNR